MRKIYFLLVCSVIFSSCKETTSQNSANEPINKKVDSLKNNDNLSLQIKYAKSFNIKDFIDYKVIIISNPWPGSNKIFKYALVNGTESIPADSVYDAIIHVPVNTIVVTSTTHIPSLEMLDETDKLIGFPNLNYISSSKVRQLVDKGKIRELGKNESINTEVLMELSPSVIVGYGVDNENSTFNTIQKMGIPVMYNADWTETSPLGKAEWIKFFGAIFDKNYEADSIFSIIEKNYNEAKNLAAKAKTKPTVLSGAMYKDVWYLPQGNSWAAQFIADSNGDYIWKDTEGTGSLSLNLEAVLERGKNAAYWIGPGQFISLSQMKDAHSVYSEFVAFKQGKVFSFTNNKGETGGVLYYELAPNRPDLVLKDIIKAIHPELLPNYTPYFFTKLK